MTVRDQLVTLAELAHIDRRVKELETKIKSLPHKADAAEALANDKEAKEKAIDGLLHQIVADRRKLDSDVNNERSNVRKWESRAEKIRGEREYTALMSEIAQQKKTISDLETKILENMQESEQLEKKQIELAAAAQNARSVAREEWAEVKDEVDVCNAELVEQNMARDLLIPKLPSNVAKRYLQIRDKRAGQAIAVITREICQACQRMVPPELFIQIMRNEVIEQCPSCQRILVADFEEIHGRT